MCVCSVQNGYPPIHEVGQSGVCVCSVLNVYTPIHKVGQSRVCCTASTKCLLHCSTNTNTLGWPESRVCSARDLQSVCCTTVLIHPYIGSAIIVCAAPQHSCPYKELATVVCAAPTECVLHHSTHTPIHRVGQGRVCFTAWAHTCRVGQNCIYTPYMTVYLVISLPKIPYTVYIWFWPTLHTCIGLAVTVST